MTDTILFFCLHLNRRVRRIAKSDHNLRHVCLPFHPPVSPSLRMEQLGCHWTNFHEIWHLSIVLKSVEQNQVSLKSNKRKGYFTKRPVYVYVNISLNYVTVRYVSDKFVEEIETYFMLEKFFRKLCRLWDNVEKCGRAGQVTDASIIERMPFACWISKATDTHSE
jgi:hypothetical protein